MIFIIRYIERPLRLTGSDRPMLQIVGIKSNFAQPFFIHWDTLLGTRMTREDIERRRQKAI